MHPPLRLGSRASAMAVAMSEHARDLVHRIHPQIPIELRTFLSEGDRIKGDLKVAGGKGTFIKDLERRLLAGEIDCAVHALKDVPGDVPMHPDLMLLTFLEREDPRDALILREGVREEDLAGRVVGTSAPRRTALLRHLYPGVRIETCRGNADTRLRKLDDGQYDAIVLSAAGLDRLGRQDRIARRYGADEMMPAVGQGISCIQVRRSDAERCTYLRAINDDWTETAALVERNVLHGLQGTCHSAIAAHCTREGGRVTLHAMVLDDATGRVLRSRREADAGEPDLLALGHLAAADLLGQGARAIL